MSRDRLHFPVEQLVPASGEIYSSILENSNTGLIRNLFWSIWLEFQPIEYDGSEINCAMYCERIRWPLRDWRELDGQRLDAPYGENGIQPSYYMGRHDSASRVQLSVHRLRDNRFMLDMEMLVDFRGYAGGDENPAMPVRARVELPYLGLMIMPDNLFPKPKTREELRAVAGEFVDLAAYEDVARWKLHGYIFRPLGFVDRYEAEENHE